ncbi:MAG: hypothetical protein FJW56_11395 [Actinobacteria bacterium]|nr:hypothetical protein [Actinomycetota bacterium]
MHNLAISIDFVSKTSEEILRIIDVMRAIVTSPINLNILNVSNITQSVIGKTILILYNTVDIFLNVFC